MLLPVTYYNTSGLVSDECFERPLSEYHFKEFTPYIYPASEFLPSASNLYLTTITLFQMLCPGRYNGPEIAAQAVEKYFGNGREKAYILDVASGTGLVGDKVSERRVFTRMRALVDTTKRYLLRSLDPVEFCVFTIWLCL